MNVANQVVYLPCHSISEYCIVDIDMRQQRPQTKLEPSVSPTEEVMGLFSRHQKPTLQLPSGEGKPGTSAAQAVRTQTQTLTSSATTLLETLCKLTGD